MKKFIEQFILKSKYTKVTIEETKQITEKQWGIYTKLYTVIVEEQVYRNPNLTIDLLAKYIHTNRTELSSVIRNFTQKSYPTFINEQRVEFAKTLLTMQDQKLSIEGVAKESGFKSASNFYKVFKTNTGKTPNEFQISS